MTTLAHEQEALDHALTILRRHEPTAGGGCTCQRPWPCNIADRVAERAAELATTVDALHAALHQPTMAIPHLASRRSEDLHASRDRIHIHDSGRHYNGSDRTHEWTVCGRIWPPEGQEDIWPHAPACEECLAEEPPKPHWR